MTQELVTRLRELATDVHTQVSIMGRMNVSVEDARLLHAAAEALEASERRAADLHEKAKELYAEGLKVGIQIGEAKARGERIP